MRYFAECFGKRPRRIGSSRCPFCSKSHSRIGLISRCAWRVIQRLKSHVWSSAVWIARSQDNASPSKCRWLVRSSCPTSSLWNDGSTAFGLEGTSRPHPQFPGSLQGGRPPQTLLSLPPTTEDESSPSANEGGSKIVRRGRRPRMRKAESPTPAEAPPAPVFVPDRPPEPAPAAQPRQAPAPGYSGRRQRVPRRGFRVRAKATVTLTMDRARQGGHGGGGGGGGGRAAAAAANGRTAIPGTRNKRKRGRHGGGGWRPLAAEPGRRRIAPSRAAAPALGSGARFTGTIFRIPLWFADLAALGRPAPRKSPPARARRCTWTTFTRSNLADLDGVRPGA